jgi:hypothetical protein
MDDFLAKGFVEGAALPSPRLGQTSVGAMIVMNEMIPGTWLVDELSRFSFA